MRTRPPYPPRCPICNQPRMKIKDGVYGCPGSYGSPMHMLSPVLIGEEQAKARLEERYGCTLGEYLAARERAQT